MSPQARLNLFNFYKFFLFMFWHNSFTRYR
jgi:hypothetical protein